MSRSRLLRPALRAATTETVIGLLTATGMRSGELARLGRGDVDLEAGRLRVIATKFNKSRALALHASTVEALDAYRCARDRCWPRPATTGSSCRAAAAALARAALSGPSPNWSTKLGWRRPRGRGHAAEVA